MMDTFETLPELKKSRNPEENKNPDFLAQARLIARSTFHENEWVQRYAEAFRRLFDTDDQFRELAQDLSDEHLLRMQEMLERKVSGND